MRNSDSREILSALADAEHQPGELDQALAAARSDSTLAGVWRRYHVIGAVMRNEPGDYIGDAALVSRIHSAIESEPVRIAPHRPLAVRVLRPVAGLAIAASVAAVVVFGLREASLFELPAGPVAKVALKQAPDAASWKTLSPEQQNTLNGYLVEHGEFTPASGMNGLSAYARFVSYDAAQ